MDGENHAAMSRVLWHPMGRARLPRRQWECVRMVAEGMARKEIAKELRLSVKTVEYHLKCAGNCLGLKNNPADWTRWAIAQGIVNV